MRDDFELLLAWREGDGTAGNELFDRHFAALYRFFRNKVRDESEDLVQQTFLRCVQSRDRFRGDSSFRTYLFAVARHVLCTHLQERRRKDGPVDWEHVSCADLGISPSGLVARRDEQRLLLLALRRLPLYAQIALELYYFEGFRGPRLAEALGVPEGTIRSRLRRGQQALRRELERLAAGRALIESTASDLDDWARDLREQVLSKSG